jgi:hypothetical protein
MRGLCRYYAQVLLNKQLEFKNMDSRRQLVLKSLLGFLRDSDALTTVAAWVRLPVSTDPGDTIRVVFEHMQSSVFGLVQRPRPEKGLSQDDAYNLERLMVINQVYDHHFTMWIRLCEPGDLDRMQKLVAVCQKHFSGKRLRLTVLVRGYKAHKDQSPYVYSEGNIELRSTNAKFDFSKETRLLLSETQIENTRVSQRAVQLAETLNTYETDLRVLLPRDLAFSGTIDKAIDFLAARAALDHQNKAKTDPGVFKSTADLISTVRDHFSHLIDPAKLQLKLLVFTNYQGKLDPDRPQRLEVFQRYLHFMIRIVAQDVLSQWLDPSKTLAKLVPRFQEALKNLSPDLFGRLEKEWLIEREDLQKMLDKQEVHHGEDKYLIHDALLAFEKNRRKAERAGLEDLIKQPTETANSVRLMKIRIEQLDGEIANFDKLGRTHHYPFQPQQPKNPRTKKPKKNPR